MTICRVREPHVVGSVAFSGRASSAHGAGGDVWVVVRGGPCGTRVDLDHAGVASLTQPQVPFSWASHVKATGQNAQEGRLGVQTMPPRSRMAPRLDCMAYSPMRLRQEHRATMADARFILARIGWHHATHRDPTFFPASSSVCSRHLVKCVTGSRLSSTRIQRP